MNRHVQQKFFGTLCFLITLWLLPQVVNAQVKDVPLFKDGPSGTVFKGKLPVFYLSPAEVSASEVMLRLNIIDDGDGNTEEFGVIWSKEPRPSYINNVGRHAFPAPAVKGVYSYPVKGLAQNENYFAYAYIVVDGKMHISSEISFVNSPLNKRMRAAALRSGGCGGVGETVFLDQDNENNAGTGVGDKDFGKENYRIDDTYSNYPIEFNLFTTQKSEMDGILAIYAHDVDEEDGEIDDVFFNGVKIGHLSGNDGTYNTTTFRIPKEQIVQGQNKIKVTVAEGWMVSVLSAQLLINGGVGDKASIGELTINSAEKTSSSVNVKIAADIKVCTPGEFSVETNLIDPDNSNVYTTKNTFQASSDVIDKELSLTLPLSSKTGVYIANFYLFDKNTGVMLHSASINIEHTSGVGVNPLVVAITPSTELTTNQPVVLTCKAKSVIPTEATITGIKTPGATAHNGKDEALYTAMDNGTYTFTVYYTQKGTAKTKDFTYTVKNIVLPEQAITWNQDFTTLKVGVPFVLSATATSGGAVTFSANNPQVATISGNAITFLKANTGVSVTATQAGGNGYKPATLSKTLTAQKGQIVVDADYPTIGTGSSAPKVDEVLKFPAVTKANASISYTVIPSDAATITKVGNEYQITILKPVEIKVTATVAGNANYENGTKDFVFTTQKGTHTLTWSQTFTTVKVGEAVTLTATSSKNVPVVYSSSNSSIASVSGSQLTFHKVNQQVTITATSSNASYVMATLTKDITITQKGEVSTDADYPEIGTGTNAPRPGETLKFPAKTKEGNEISYTASPTDGVTITKVGDEYQITILQVGKVTITAHIAGDADYNSTNKDFVVDSTQKGVHTLTWDQTFTDIKVGEAVVLTAVSSRNVPVVYSSSNETVASVSGSELIFHKVNQQVTITATSGNNSYETTTATKNITAVQKGETPTDADYPEIGTGSDAPKPGEVLKFPAKTEDGKEITYTASPADGAEIAKSGDEYHITIVKVGKVTITAHIAGDVDHDAANKDFVVESTQKGTHTLTWNQIFTTVKVGEAVTLTAISSRNVPVVYSSSNPAIASVSGSQLTFHKVNQQVTIMATSGDASYETVTLTKDITVTQKGEASTDADYPEIGTGSNAPKPGEILKFPAKTEKGNDITYTATPADGATITKVGNEYHIMILKVGKVTITAYIASDADHNSANKDFVVESTQKGTHIVTWDQTFADVRVNKAVTLVASSSRNVAVTFASADPAIASVKDNEVVFHQYNKEVEITATSGDDSYEVQTVGKRIKASEKGVRTVVWEQVLPETTAGSALELTATVTPRGTVEYTSSDNTVAYLKGNSVIAIKQGTVTLTATTVSDNDYENAKAEKAFKVAPLTIDSDKEVGEVELPEEEEILNNIVITVNENGALNLNKEIGESGEDVHVKEFVIHRKDENVGAIFTDATNNVYPEKLTLKAEYTPNKWYFISLPFDQKLSEISSVYGADYVMGYYDAEQRAQNQRNNWKMMSAGETLKAHQGYLIQTLKEGVTIEFATNAAEKIKNAFTNENVPVGLACPDAAGTATSYNKGWNFVGIPYLSYYKTSFDDKILYIYDEQTENYVPVGKNLDLESYSLRPWTGFMLQSDSEADQLPFVSSNRESGQLPKSVKANTSHTSDRFVFELRQGGNSDRAIVVLNTKASSEYVINEDAAKFFSMNNELPQLYTTTSDGAVVAMNCIPEENEGTFDLFAKTPQTDSYELVLAEIADGFSEVVVTAGKREVVLKEGDSFAIDAAAGELNFKVAYSRDNVKLNNNGLDELSMWLKNGVLRMEGLPEGSGIAIYSATGALMASEQIAGTAFNCELPQGGVYMVHVTVNGLNKVFKVVR